MGYCAKEFILRKIPKGKLNAISDIESLFNSDTRNNEFY